MFLECRVTSPNWDGGRPEMERTFTEVLPGMEAAIKYPGTTVADIGSKFLRSNYMILAALSLLLAGGIWLTYYNVSKELKLARLKSDFVANVSHELRTPVSLIRTEAELALRRSRTESEYKEALEHILLEAERTTTLIEQLLSVARADSGRETLHIETVNLSENLRSVVESWKQVAAIRDLEFAANISDCDALVIGDEVLLRRLADILLDNAFKYTPTPGSVRLSLEQKPDSAVITVQDSGVGIAQQDHSKIFERFYRVDKARSRAQGGTGLGLSIAQWIVTQHRGSITVESRPGEGATFRVELPKIATPVQNPQPA